MNETNYARIRNWFMANQMRYQIFIFIYRFLPAIVFCTYSILIIVLLYHKDSRIIKVTLIPFIIFVLVSILRKIIDLPRPYTVMNIEPLIQKNKTGESFPSRHVLSVSIIAVACFFVNLWLGILMCILSVLIAIVRVISGVHFIKDVICGALISYIIGGLLFYLL